MPEKCGCKVETSVHSPLRDMKIIYCPLHAAAPVMLEAAETHMEKDKGWYMPIESQFNACMYRRYCLSLKTKLQAAEEMAKALKTFVAYYAGSQKSHLGNGQAYKSHSQMEIALSAWNKAGKAGK